MTKTRENRTFSSNTRFLAIDYGQKVVGLSSFYSGEDLYPVPFGTIPYKDDTQLVCDLLQIIHRETIQEIILGLPTLLDGKHTSMTKKIQHFGHTLQAKLPIEVTLHWQDETLSSFEAIDRLKFQGKIKKDQKKQKKQIDALAATIILEDFLREHALLK